MSSQVDVSMSYVRSTCVTYTSNRGPEREIACSTLQSAARANALNIIIISSLDKYVHIVITVVYTLEPGTSCCALFVDESSKLVRTTLRPKHARSLRVSRPASLTHVRPNIPQSPSINIHLVMRSQSAVDETLCTR